jgi:hypothetical protein
VDRCSIPYRDLAQSVLARIEELWAQAGVEPEYVSAMRSTLVARPTRGAASQTARNTLPLSSLPSLCCEAAGGEWRHTIALTAAWALLYEAAHRLDGVEDGEAETDSVPASGRAINCAIGLIASAGLTLGNTRNSQAAQAIQSDFWLTVLKMGAGQHTDLWQIEPTLEQCWQIAEAKSGSFFALACRAGARLATEEQRRIDHFGQFGQGLGILIQVADDIHDLSPAAGERSDLTTKRTGTLPVTYAQSVLPALERNRLCECLRAAPVDADAAKEARRRIIESGAILYLVVEAERHRRQAEAALFAAAPPSVARG